MRKNPPAHSQRNMNHLQEQVELDTSVTTEGILSGLLRVIGALKAQCFIVIIMEHDKNVDG